jgi:hypothetical protein
MTGPTTSSGSPMRPSGIAAARSASGNPGSRNGVRMGPGATALARMPCGASSSASDLVSASTPALAAA